MNKNVSKKESGSYYTPSTLADFMVFHLLGEKNTYNLPQKISVLEPSAGDGIFFNALFDNQVFKGRFDRTYDISVTAVEYEPEAYDLLRGNTTRYKKVAKSTRYVRGDYLEFHQANKKKYDLVIGNPPYIKSNLLSKEQIEFCELIHKQSDLSPKKIKNIWTSFLMGGVESLNDNGVICFVLPAEILQVIYAKEIRDRLKQVFKRIEIFTFNEIIFPQIEQDSIILICSKKGEEAVSFYHVDKLEQLEKPEYVPDHSNVHRKTLDKWTNYILSDDELKFLDRLRSSMSIKPINEYCTAVVGVVTAANSYFITDNETVRQRKLKSVVTPMLQKGLYKASGLRFRTDDLNRIGESGSPTNFLAFDNEDESKFSNSLRDYLRYGEQQGINLRYKCRLRDRWYVVPSVWSSEGFFTKRSGLFPRMYINDANCLVTDSFYRIRMNQGRRIEDLTFSFHNTLTFIYAELEGRYYGGSVLELMPNEYKHLPVPYVENVPETAIDKLDGLLRGGNHTSEVLAYTNKIILKRGYGLSDQEVDRLEGIYKRLLKRRWKTHNYEY